MSCEQVREQLMELDVADFDTIPHLGGCPACRHLADEIRRAERGATAHVEAFAHAGSFEEDWAAALHAARPRRRWWALGATGLAAAAALLLALRVGWEGTPATLPLPDPTPAIAPADAPAEPIAEPPVAPDTPARPVASPPVPRPAPRPRPRPARSRPAPRTAPRLPEPAPAPLQPTAPTPEPAPAPLQPAVPPPATAPEPHPAAEPSPVTEPPPVAQPPEPSLLVVEIQVAGSGYTAASLRCPGHRGRAELRGSVLVASIPDATCTARITGGGPPIQAQLRPGRYALIAGADGIQLVPGP